MRRTEIIKGGADKLKRSLRKATSMISLAVIVQSMYPGDTVLYDPEAMICMYHRINEIKKGK